MASFGTIRPKLIAIMTVPAVNPSAIVALRSSSVECGPLASCRRPRAVAVEQAVDEVQIAGAATARADGEFARQMRLGASREGSDLLVPDVDPLDLALSSQSVGEGIEGIADYAIDPLDARGCEGLRELISH